MDIVTWTIVQFTEDMSVEAIPTSWIQGDICHWPPYSQQKLMAAIRKCEALNTCWPTHSIKIFRNATFDDYGKARTKARHAEATSNSDLNSETENGKRKRIQKILSSSSEEESFLESKLPPPPKIKKAEIEPFSKKNQNSSATYVKDFSFPVVLNELSNNSNENLSIANKRITSEHLNTSTSDRTCCEHGTLLLEIKQQNHFIRGVLADIMNEITAIKVNINTNKAETSSVAHTSVFVKYTPDIMFPIKTNEELDIFKEILNIEKNFSEAVTDVAKLGGSNIYNFVKRSMSALVKDEILIKYSWYGRKGKKPLCKLLLGKLLICAADTVMKTTEKITEMAIQNYMKRCQERISAKENRKCVNTCQK